MTPKDNIPDLRKKGGPVVAIDGPAGTGKSSATKRLAEKLGFVHVDTGALYRSIALELLNQDGSRVDFSADTIVKVIAIAKTAQFQFKRDPKLNPSNRLFFNSKDVTTLIRTPEVSLVSSRVSAIPEVRAALLGLQRTLGGKGKSILEGRDIGTVVFPDADVKFFLTASVEERAKRRLAELEATGADVPSFTEVQAQISERDFADETRAVAPLKKASDAIVLDTSQMTLDEVVTWMEKTVRDKLAL
jgi:CMP/dCMP kinase